MQSTVWAGAIVETLIYICFFDLIIKAYDSVDRTLLWTALVPLFWRATEYDLDSIVNSTMACEHACGSTTGCARGGSLWNRAFVKAACSRPLYVQHLLYGGYKRGLRAFQGGQRHHVGFGASGEEIT